MPDAIDMAVVDELLSLSEEGDPELLVDLIQMYLQDGPIKLEEMNAGVAQQDYERVERAAHSLKGAAGNLGAVLVQKDCDALQQASRQRALDELKRGLRDLRTHFREAEAALQKLLAKYT
jgi:HPt (histidine-containing phosphotransfer) domain-containing protein